MLFRAEKINRPLQRYVAKFCAFMIPIMGAVTSVRIAAGSPYSSSEVVLPACNCSLMLGTLAYLAAAHRWAAPLWLTELWVTVTLSVLSVSIQVRRGACSLAPAAAEITGRRRARGVRSAWATRALTPFPPVRSLSCALARLLGCPQFPERLDAILDSWRTGVDVQLPTNFDPALMPLRLAFLLFAIGIFTVRPFSLADAFPHRLLS